MNERVKLTECTTKNDFEIAKKITQDYIKWSGIDLFFQNIDTEMQNFEQIYSKPYGIYIYAAAENQIFGGGAFRKLDEFTCEMKRLFVYENLQGQGIGKSICEKLFEAAKGLGYKKMRLDTISKLNKAIKLYEKLGFYYIDSYRFNPDPTVKFMEKIL